jgi:hypothetical protein
MYVVKEMNGGQFILQIQKGRTSQLETVTSEFIRGYSPVFAFGSFGIFNIPQTLHANSGIVH